MKRGAALSFILVPSLGVWQSPENDTRGKGTPITDVSQSQGSFSFISCQTLNLNLLELDTAIYFIQYVLSYAFAFAKDKAKIDKI
jgi:hypothetical protein